MGRDSSELNWKGFAWRILYRNGLSNTWNYVNYAEMQVSATELV